MDLNFRLNLSLCLARKLAQHYFTFINIFLISIVTVSMLCLIHEFKSNPTIIIYL